MIVNRKIAIQLFMQFQILVISTFFVSVVIVVFVFAGIAFNAGFMPLVSSIFLFTSICGIYWTFFTPAGKTFASNYNEAKNQNTSLLAQKNYEAREHFRELKESFRSEIEVLQNNKINGVIDASIQESVRRVLNDLEKQVQHTLLASTLFDALDKNEKISILRLLLSTCPEDPKVQTFALKQIKRGVLYSTEAYAFALEILEVNPNLIKVKTFVLEVGRFHFAKLRGGKVTIYDEQAIQNDIQARSK